MSDSRHQENVPTKPSTGQGFDFQLLADAPFVLAAAAGIVFTALDLLGFLHLEWFEHNLHKLTLLLLSFVIISSLIERRLHSKKDVTQELLETLRVSQPSAVLRRIEGAGISNFYQTRADFALYRSATRLSDYLDSARHTIGFAAYWMAHGIDMEDVASELARLASDTRRVTIVVAVLDPTAAYLESLGDYLGMSAAEIRSRAQYSLFKLHAARERLDTRSKARFRIKVYTAMPIASVILLDAGQPDGRLQIDFKAYKTPRNQSFSFELRGDNKPLYALLKSSSQRLLDESPDFDANVHLKGFNPAGIA
jgi:hypothetical protein